MPAPTINNSWTRVALRRVRAMPTDERDIILNAIPADTRALISKTKTSAYIPAPHAVAVCDALIQRLGAEGAVDFWETIVSDSYVGGLFEPLITKLRHDELEHGMLGLASEAWAITAENCGSVGLANARDGKVRLEARDFPAEVRDSPGIQTMFAGALRAMLGFSSLSASVEISTDNEDGSIAFELKFR